MGPGVANECVGDQGRPDDLGRSFLPRDHRPSTGEVLPDGSEGELVFTSLTKEGLPSSATARAT